MFCTEFIQRSYWSCKSKFEVSMRCKVRGFYGTKRKWLLKICIPFDTAQFAPNVWFNSWGPIKASRKFVAKKVKKRNIACPPSNGSGIKEQNLSRYLVSEVVVLLLLVRVQGVPPFTQNLGHSPIVLVRVALVNERPVPFGEDDEGVHGTPDVVPLLLLGNFHQIQFV